MVSETEPNFERLTASYCLIYCPTVYCITVSPKTIPVVNSTGIRIVTETFKQINTFKQITKKTSSTSCLRISARFEGQGTGVCVRLFCLFKIEDVECALLRLRHCEQGGCRLRFNLLRLHRT